MKVSFLKPLAVAAAVLAAPAAADAGWVTANSGNTVVTAPDKSADGVINFAVYDNNDGSFAAYVAGKGGVSSIGSDPTPPAPTTFGKYVYAYQIVNTNPSNNNPNPDLVALVVQVNPSTVVSYGQIRDTVFTENNAAATPTGTGGVTLAVGGGTNTRLDGSSTDGGFVAGARNQSSAGTTVDLGGVSPTGTARPATDAFIAMSPQGGDGLEFLVRLAGGRFSNVVFFTSDLAPVTTGGAILQGFLNANGTVDGPHRAPEPGTMALLGLGLPLAGFGYRRRLRAQAAKSALTA